MNDPFHMPPRALLAELVRTQSGPEADYDVPTTEFLQNARQQLQSRLAMGPSLLEVDCLGQRVPWLYLLTFSTTSLGRTHDGQIVPITRHSIALRFLPDCLRKIDRFESLLYVSPREPTPWHPNICPERGAICVELFPGESVLEIVLSLHELLRYRLRQYDERDALNWEACVYGRNHVAAPLDERPLFGKPLTMQLQPASKVYS